jgi:Protein of unknown function (DUF4446)
VDSFQSAYHQHAFSFWFFLLIVIALVALWVLFVQMKVRRIGTDIDKVFQGASGENTSKMLVDYLTTVRSTAGTVSQVKAEHDQIAQLVPSMIRHIGLVRFSPFHDTGGDQSFTLALLNGKGDGVVLTALHSRTDSRLYAKPIEAGGSAYALTPEERGAMDQALGRSVVETRT